MLNFLKKTAGCIVFLYLFSFLARLSLKALQFPGIRAIEWILPVMGACLYTLWIYKEQFTSKQILKICLYSYLISFVSMLWSIFVAKIYMRPEILKFLDGSTIESLKVLFSEYNTTEVMFWTYLSLGFTFLLLAPVLVGLEFLSIKLGNKLGVFILKNK